MKLDPTNITNKRISKDALETIRKHSVDQATLIDTQARIVAHKRGDDVVLKSHVEEAIDILQTRIKKNHSKELLVILGSAFFGAFVPGFITELSSGRDILVTIYTVLGLIGISLVFIGLQR